MCRDGACGSARALITIAMFVIVRAVKFVHAGISIGKAQARKSA